MRASRGTVPARGPRASWASQRRRPRRREDRPPPRSRPARPGRRACPRRQRPSRRGGGHATRLWSRTRAVPRRKTGTGGGLRQISAARRPRLRRRRCRPLRGCSTGVRPGLFSALSAIARPGRRGRIRPRRRGGTGRRKPRCARPAPAPQVPSRIPDDSVTEHGSRRSPPRARIARCRAPPPSGWPAYPGPAPCTVPPRRHSWCAPAR
jgi:hypothetical protein